MTFFIRARGKGGCLKSGGLSSAIVTCLVQKDGKKMSSVSPWLTKGWSGVVETDDDDMLACSVGAMVNLVSVLWPTAAVRDA